jgi:hypothetical protein
MHGGYIVNGGVYGMAPLHGGEGGAGKERFQFQIKVLAKKLREDEDITYLLITDTSNQKTYLMHVGPTDAFVLFLVDTRGTTIFYTDMASSTQLVQPVKKLQDLQGLYSATVLDKAQAVVNARGRPVRDKVKALAAVHEDFEAVNLEATKYLFWDAGYVHVDLAGTATVLAPLNAALQRRCPDLTLRLDLLSAQPGRWSVYTEELQFINTVALCLYYRGNCIASATWQVLPEDPRMELEVQTHPVYDGRKFMKLLTAATVLLAPLTRINGVALTTLVSKVIVPASGWVILSTYAYKLKEAAKLAAKMQSASPQKQVKLLVKRLQKTGAPVVFTVPLDAHNQQQARAVFTALTGDGGVACDSASLAAAESTGSAPAAAPRPLKAMHPPRSAGTKAHIMYASEEEEEPAPVARRVIQLDLNSDTESEAEGGVKESKEELAPPPPAPVRRVIQLDLNSDTTSEEESEEEQVRRPLSSALRRRRIMEDEDEEAEPPARRPRTVIDLDDDSSA